LAVKGWSKLVNISAYFLFFTVENILLFIKLTAVLFALIFFTISLNVALKDRVPYCQDFS